MPITRPHILVINSDLPLLDLFRDMLEGEGYRVSVSLTAETSIHLVKQVAPDLILLDPVDRSGDVAGDLVWQLRHDPVTAGVGVLICTGLVNRFEQVWQHRTDEWVPTGQKPFDIDDLLPALSQIETMNSSTQIGEPGTSGLLGNFVNPDPRESHWDQLHSN